MARLTEDDIEKQLKNVSRYRDKNAKLAWRRKRKKMDELLEEVRPIEEQILELVKQKQPIYDKIEDLRMEMIKECVHPYESLAHKGTHIECKFCKTKIRLNENMGEEADENHE